MFKPALVDHTQRRTGQITRMQAEHVTDIAPTFDPVAAVEKERHRLVVPIAAELLAFEILVRLAQHGRPQIARSLHDGGPHTTPKRYIHHRTVSIGMSDFDACLAFTLREEGGYQCLPADRGNWSTGVIDHGTLIGTCH